MTNDLKDMFVICQQILTNIKHIVYIIIKLYWQSFFKYCLNKLCQQFLNIFLNNFKHLFYSVTEQIIDKVVFVL